MTGEMPYINPETGEDSNGEFWPMQLAVAKAIGGTLKPFDVYQGPYIVVGGDLTVGNSPYAIPVQNLSIIRLWIGDDDKGTFVYREDIDHAKYIFPCEHDAIEAAKELLQL